MKNPHKGRSKVNPQPEDGYRRINTDVLKALMAADLTGVEFRVCLSVIHRSWGFKSDSAPLAVSTIGRDTGIARRTVQKALTRLKRKRILIAEVSETVLHGQALKRYMFNKHYDTWGASTSEQADTSEPEGTSAQKGSKLVPVRAPYIDSIIEKDLPQGGEPPSEHNQLVHYWLDGYEAKEGIKYNLTGKDAKLLKQLLTRHGFDSVRRAMQWLLDTEDDFIRSKMGITIGTLSTRWNNIAQQVKAQSSGDFKFPWDAGTKVS